MIKTIAAFGILSSLILDPGLWDYTKLPREQLKQKYGFEVTREWADHLRLSSVRFTRASGSFISSQGLALTNHHVVENHLSSLGLLETGFLAETNAAERPLPGEKLLQLQEITDVTTRIRAAEDGGVTPVEKRARRAAEIAAVRSEVPAPFESEVVSLYDGGLFHLYRYKAYTDVRLVFAPEKKIAFFGGDGDNFEFPRYDLDMAIVRAYEDGKPAQTEHFLALANTPVTEGDLIFVSGHPGSTQRLLPVSAIEFFRTTALPLYLDYLRSVETMYTQYAQNGDAEARQVESDIFSTANARKNYEGRMDALAGTELLQQKRLEESELMQAVVALQDTKPEVAKMASAWDTVASAYRAYADIYKELEFFESVTGMRRTIGSQPAAFQSGLFGVARQIVRLAHQADLPDEQRLPEYRGASWAETRGRVLNSDLTFDRKLEAHRLAHALAFAVKHLGADHPVLQTVLAGQTPVARAAALVRGTRLYRADVRSSLVQNNGRAIHTSADPLIKLALAIEPAALRVRKVFEDQVAPQAALGLSQLARLRFEVGGDNLYPDATFTLRLSYGTVKGYRSAIGESIPWRTTVGDTFRHADRHGNRGDWQLPESWLAAKGALEQSTTPFNFVSSADIIGGNSGSPVTNRAGELVGLIFDGNIESLPNAFRYNEDPDRAVSVHVSGILEALRTVYGAHNLVSEMGH